ncbi:hypothetical protein FRC09_016456 [Ceratobasidium sp. 395]|nr:hypothetical protein FRC09_016456 [Ceratobasidium sp. 395]
MSDAVARESTSFSYQPPLGGDVPLKSSDGVVFVAHSMFLALASPVFAGMFSPVVQQDMIELQEDAESVSLMLRFIYPPVFLGDLSLPLLKKSLHMGQKYDIDGILTAVDHVVSRSFDESTPLKLDPVETFELASRYRLKATQKAAAKLISQLRDGEDVKRLAEALPAYSGIIGLLGAQSLRVQALAALLGNLPPNLHAPKVGWEDGGGVMMCRECINRELYSPRPGMRYQPIWLYCWAAIAQCDLIEKPFTECSYLFHVSILHEIEQLDGVCQDCIQAARDAGDGQVFKTWAQEMKDEVKAVFTRVESLYCL